MLKNIGPLGKHTQLDQMCAHAAPCAAVLAGDISLVKNRTDRHHKPTQQYMMLRVRTSSNTLCTHAQR